MSHWMMFFVSALRTESKSMPVPASLVSVVAATAANSGTCRSPFGAFTTGIIPPPKNNDCSWAAKTVAAFAATKSASVLKPDAYAAFAMLFSFKLNQATLFGLGVYFSMFWIT